MILAEIAECLGSGMSLIHYVFAIVLTAGSAIFFVSAGVHYRAASGRIFP